MTTPKTAEEIARSIVTEIAREMTRDIDLEDSVRTAWTALDAYLLQESAPLVEALQEIAGVNRCEVRTRDNITGCIIHDSSFECLAYETLITFQKKHGVQ